MSRAKEPSKDFIWADYGIEVHEDTFAEGRTTAMVHCPRCNQYRLVVGQVSKSWHCEGCYWSGKLKGGDADQGRGMVDLQEAEPMLERWHSHGRPPALQSGLPELDSIYQPRRGEITVITGHPGDGKSTWLKWYLCRLAVRHEAMFAIFSPEDMPFHLYLGQMVVKASGKQFDLLEPRDLKLAEAWVRNHFLMIDPPEATAEGILAQVRLNQHERFSGVVIDPWTEVEHNIPNGMREDQYLNRMLTKIRRLARFLHVHIWIVVHPKRMERVNTSGKKEVPIPTMDDLAGGAMWKNKPDWGLAIHRPFKAQGTEDMWVDVHVQKARFSGFLGGSLGCKRLEYENATGTYNDGSEKKMADGRMTLSLEAPLEEFKRRTNTKSAYQGYFDKPDWTWPPRDPAALRPIMWLNQDGGGWWHNAERLQAFIDKTGSLGKWNATVRLKSDVTSKRTTGPFDHPDKAFGWAERILMEWDSMPDPREAGGK